MRRVLTCVALIHLPQERDVVTSRRHASKIMYLGVIARPHTSERPHAHGKIFLTRIAKKNVMKRGSVSKELAFSSDVNEAVQEQWRDFVDASMTLEEMQREVATAFSVDVSQDRIAFSFREARSGKLRYLAGTPASEGVALADLTLCARRLKGDTVMEDCSCDSDFMLKVMVDVGTAIRNYFHWVPASTEIELIQDNAGGHGTRACVATYTLFLKVHYNIKLTHQPPNSPDGNPLDLGVWRSLQSAVEKLHFRQRKSKDALDNTMRRAWAEYSPQRMLPVFERLYDVAEATITAAGDNVHTEKQRGVTRKRLKELSE